MSYLEIPLNSGFSTIIDKNDLSIMGEYAWGAYFMSSPKRLYVVRRKTISFKKSKLARLHREIMDAPDNMIVDHINGNTLDNRRCNLRICTIKDNARNRRPNKSKKYKGVSFCKKQGKWRAYVAANERGIKNFKSLGYYDNEVDAAAAHNEAIKLLHGEFACLNLF